MRANQTQSSRIKPDPTQAVRSRWIKHDQAGSRWIKPPSRGEGEGFDFWTYCGIHGIHVVHDLKSLEAKYPNQLVIIGVHSAKKNSVAPPPLAIPFD